MKKFQQLTGDNMYSEIHLAHTLIIIVVGSQVEFL